MTAQGRTPCDGAAISAAAETRGCADSAKTYVLAATILGSSLAFIDGSVVTVALPEIQSELAGSVAGAQWVVNAYMLMLGALVLVGGAAGDRFGRRRIFISGIVLFTLASIACGFAPSTAILVGSRTLQGVGAALLVPSSLAIISSAFPKEERGRAIGIWAGFSALTTAFGPMLGGFLVDALSWRAIFFVNVPVALATLGLAWARVPESRGEVEQGPLDWRGGALAVAWLFCLAFGLTDSATLGWTHPAIAGALAASLLLLVLFLRTEMRIAAPMVPLALFRSANFSAANAITLLLYFALSGVLFFLPFALIRGSFWSATEAGAAFLPFTLLAGILSPWAGALVPRIGARLPLVIGPLLTAAGYAWVGLAAPVDSYWRDLLPGMLLLGLGMAIAVAPLTTLVMGSVSERHAGVASGINNAVARTAGMLAVALLGALAVSLFRSDLDRRLAPLPLAAEMRQAIAAEVPRLAEAEVPPAIQGAQRQTVEQALRQSFIASYRIVTLICAGLAALGALAALLFVRA